ncbi:multidrug effflux MFS transporter [Kaustia mangrovi]|uniref:Bcr/CflA family efflux transporter n=1 Tax=Kaustia mangrovi TaxID=2593653 RepID=A0A7S8C4T2_9HYPH|nr:multidrug effflux MFS transporter [Kaustia mangrovi]QPC43391.1 multidrug effflux MFS transporter [Kaustia mangrovi]
MRLKPGTAGMTVVLALLTSMGPLSTDMYLPSLPGITKALETDTASVQLTLSAFLVGFALGQIVFGPVSDRFGRRPVLIAGLAAFAVATLGCMLARSIELLIAARFGQAVAACAGVVVARAIVRDLYRSEDAARMLSFMGALMGLVPAVAPVIGGLIDTALGWRAVFGTITALGVALTVLVAFALPETLALSNRQPATLAGMAASFRVLLAHRQFRRYVAVVCTCFGGLFAFISGSSFLLQGHYGLNELGFGLFFGAGVLGYIAGTLIGARLTMRVGIAGTIAIGTGALAAGGLAMIALVLFGPETFWALSPMIVYMAGVGLTLPQSMAGAITPFPERAGAASSLMGFAQMAFGAAVGILVGHTVHMGPLPLAVIIAAMGVVSLAITVGARRDGIL